MRIIAPLLVLALLAVVLARWASNPAEAADRAWIAAAWDRAAFQPETRETLLRRLDRYLAGHGNDPEARWFAARAYLKVGAIHHAIDVIWTDESLAASPGTARRFGRLLLRTLGFLDDENLELPRVGATMANLILAQGGDEQASALLDETIHERVEGGLLDVLYGTFLYGSREGARKVAAALRDRPFPESRVVAALAALGPDPYPERTGDVAALEDVAEDEGSRREQRLVWASACLALGRSEEPAALDLLTTVHRRLARSTDSDTRTDGAVVAAGLLAGGRWAMLEPLAPYLAGPGPLPRVRVWYAAALVDRLARSDPQAPEAVMDLWHSIHRFPDPTLVERMATNLLLGDAVPPPEFPVDRILADLEGERSTAAMHAVAAAWRFRSGDPEGRAALLRVLRRIGESDWVSKDPLIGNPLWISPVLTVSRALFLYGDRATP